jgi:hypothetical protein
MLWQQDGNFRLNAYQPRFGVSQLRPELLILERFLVTQPLQNAEKVLGLIDGRYEFLAGLAFVGQRTDARCLAQLPPRFRGALDKQLDLRLGSIASSAPDTHESGRARNGS